MSSDPDHELSVDALRVLALAEHDPVRTVIGDALIAGEDCSFLDQEHNAGIFGAAQCSTVVAAAESILRLTVEKDQKSVPLWQQAGEGVVRAIGRCLATPWRNRQYSGAQALLYVLAMDRGDNAPDAKT